MVFPFHRSFVLLIEIYNSFLHRSIDDQCASRPHKAIKAFAELLIIIIFPLTPLCRRSLVPTHPGGTLHGADRSCVFLEGFARMTPEMQPPNFLPLDFDYSYSI